MKKLNAFIKEYAPYLVWLQALVGMLGSLFFSEIWQLPPCVLCWYQRVCLYPLVVLMPIMIMRKERKLWQYVLPLSSIGLAIAVFHNLLYYKILPEAAAPCQAGISCTTKYFEWFGFITIPSMALAAFTIITILMVWYRKVTLDDERS
jgi:disulfide bond formation protein DsbB